MHRVVILKQKRMQTSTQAQAEQRSRPPQTNTKTSRDWVMIHRAFILSDYSEVAPFLRDTYGIEPHGNGAVNRQIAGWREEKAEIKQKALYNAKMEMYRNYSPDPAVL